MSNYVGQFWVQFQDHFVDNQSIRDIFSVEQLKKKTNFSLILIDIALTNTTTTIDLKNS